VTEDSGSQGAHLPGVPLGAVRVDAVLSMVRALPDDALRLTTALALVDALQDDAGGSVARLRALGLSWQGVADIAGVTRQTAWQRWRLAGSPPVPPPDRPAGGTQ
jgi:hypothetical protein